MESERGQGRRVDSGRQGIELFFRRRNEEGAGKGGEADFQITVFHAGFLNDAKLILEDSVRKFRSDVQYEFGRLVRAVVEDQHPILKVGPNHGVLVPVGLKGAATAVPDGRVLGA